jgi:hypothetical protein
MCDVVGQMFTQWFTTEIVESCRQLTDVTCFSRYSLWCAIKISDILRHFHNAEPTLDQSKIKGATLFEEKE